MTPVEAAQLIGVHWTTVYKAVREGKLKATKTLGGITLDRGDVTSFKNRLRGERKSGRERVAKLSDPIDLPTKPNTPGYRLSGLALRWQMTSEQVLRFLRGKGVGMFRDEIGRVMYDADGIERVERDNYIEALH
jgi:excisionase family DNA binding protein